MEQHRSMAPGGFPVEGNIDREFEPELIGTIGGIFDDASKIVQAIKKAIELNLQKEGVEDGQT